MSDSTKSVTISIQDSSGAQIVFSFATLTGGQWQTQPVPGTVISPGNVLSLVNFSSSNFDSIGGSLALSPYSGGQITVSWNWPYGSQVSGGVSSTALTGLATSCQIINSQSNSPTMQVLIMNSAIFSESSSTK